jgi:spermidine synthase
MRRLFLFIYALSGCAALVYEVIWSRLLTLHIGHTVAAVSTVLAAFLGGMALGALGGGALAARRPPRDALRLYAWLELAIAASALAVPAVLAASRPMLAAAYADGNGGFQFALVRIVTAMFVVGVPAAAMGATFPVAARWIVDRAERAGAAAGGLYAANTVGAAVGASAAAFLLIPALGLRTSGLVAAALNVVAAGTALLIAARVPPDTLKHREDRARVGRARTASQAAAERGRPGLAAFALAVTGFAALVNEVVWTRVLALVTGPTTYAFGAMLSVFIAGIAAGSSLGAAIADRLKHPVVALTVMVVGIAAAPAAVMSHVEPWSMRVAEAVAAADADFADLLRIQALSAAALLLPLTFALGAAFSLALRVAVKAREGVSRDVAVVYAANTAGAIAGSLVGGFVLVPALGLQRTLLTTSLIALSGAAVGLIAARVRRRAALVGVAAALSGAIVIWRAPRWDMELLSSGGYKYAPYVQGPDIASMLRAGTTLYFKEGAAATVAVRRVAGVTSLSIEGKVDASNGGDMLTQKLLAHLPLLLHQQPRRVAIVGLGSGVTLGSALAHPIERADVIEISPEVVEASRFFEVENHRALADRRTRLIVGDGRSHVLFTQDRYDVIISEPSNPWMAGVSALFTRDFFRLARARLARGGLFCQWAHIYNMAPADLKTVVAGFTDVFPRGALFLVNEGDVLLLGGDPDLPLPEAPTLRARMARPTVREDLAGVEVASPYALASMFALGPPALAAWAAGAPRHTDDRPVLEFRAPRSLHADTSRTNAEMIARAARAAAAAASAPISWARWARAVSRASSQRASVA